MKATDPANTSKHPREALLPYLEDMLSQEDRSIVEAHLQDCPQCSNELQEIKEATDFLRTHKEVFCPEPWELYEYCQTGHDPDGRLVRHVEECPSCREAIASCAGCTEDTEMPRSMRDAVERHFGQKRLRVAWRLAESWFAGLFNYLSYVFRMPVLALGTVAAAVLLVVVFYPWGESVPIMRLSSVKWDQPGQPLIGKSLRLMAPLTEPEVASKKRPRVAVILFLKGFDKPMPQEKVDALYSALAPTASVQKRYEVLTPASIRQALGEANLKSRDVVQLAGKLNEDLDVDQLIILTVAKSGDEFEISGEARTARNSEIVSENVEREVHGVELAPKLRESALVLLETNAENR